VDMVKPVEKLNGDAGGASVPLGGKVRNRKWLIKLSIHSLVESWG
jgi:hypothetical protein